MNQSFVSVSKATTGTPALARRYVLSFGFKGSVSKATLGTPALDAVTFSVSKATAAFGERLWEWLRKGVCGFGSGFGKHRVKI